MMFAGVALLAVAANVQGANSAGSYPNKPVRVIVTFPPGGGTDLMARTIGQKLADTPGDGVVQIDDRDRHAACAVIDGTGGLHGFARCHRR